MTRSGTRQRFRRIVSGDTSVSAWVLALAGVPTSTAASSARRQTVLVAASVIGALALATPAPALAKSQTVSCGNLTVRFSAGAEGAAFKIRATRISCRRARQVARHCVSDNLSGWSVFSEPQTPGMRDIGRTRLERGDAIVTFAVVGGGGCYR